MGKDIEKLSRLHKELDRLSEISKEYAPDYKPVSLDALRTELRGYSEATLTLAVYKKVKPIKFAYDQREYMTYLGHEVCPKILAADFEGYFMEYLFPAEFSADSIVVQEEFLNRRVWNRAVKYQGIPEKAWRGAMKAAINVEVPDWALNSGPCIIHGDPTLDNVLTTRQGFIRITDPIPPNWLNKPMILAVDHGKILQSFLGWETVLRGRPLIKYEWPMFLSDYDTARRAVFWGMVAVKRIAYRDIADNITQWAKRVGKGLESLCEF